MLCVGLTACGGASEKPEPISDADAVRFLDQASFGPTPQDVAYLQSVGYSQWIDEQYSKTSTQPTHLQTVEASAIARPAAPLVVEWTRAIVSSSHGSPVSLFRTPPHRSTTFSPR